MFHNHNSELKRTLVKSLTEMFHGHCFTNISVWDDSPIRLNMWLTIIDRALVKLQKKRDSIPIVPEKKLILESQLWLTNRFHGNFPTSQNAQNAQSSAPVPGSVPQFWEPIPDVGIFPARATLNPRPVPNGSRRGWSRDEFAQKDISTKKKAW